MIASCFGRGKNGWRRLSWLLPFLLGALGVFIVGKTYPYYPLALAAFLLTHTGLPLSAVRPMACMAAAVGAAVSAAVLARRLQKRLLLCGLGCGAFYAVCLLAATLLVNGRLDWQGSNAMLPLALLLGGLLGGALTALRAGR